MQDIFFTKQEGNKGENKEVLASKIIEILTDTSTQGYEVESNK